MSHRKRFGLIAAVVLALAAGGCVDRDVSGDSVTYSFSWWVPVSSLLGAVVALPVGLLARLRRGWGRFGWGLIVISPVVGGLLVPALFLDRVTIDSEHFESRTGMWFSPNEHNVRFDDLAEIRHVTYTERGRRGRKTTKQKLVCVGAGGEVAHTVKLGDLTKRAAPEILQRARDRGISVTAARE